MRRFTDAQWHERAEIDPELVARQMQTLDALRALASLAPPDARVEAQADLGRALQRMSTMLRLSAPERARDALALCDEAAAIWDKLGRQSAAWLVASHRAELAALLGDEPACARAIHALAARLDAHPALEVYRPVLVTIEARHLARLGQLDEALRRLDAALAAVDSARMRAHLDALRAQLVAAMSR